MTFFINFGFKIVYNFGIKGFPINFLGKMEVRQIHSKQKQTNQKPTSFQRVKVGTGSVRIGIESCSS
jgi:hypothetical protein